MNQKLTLNLGLRWEMNFGFNEVAGRASMINLTKPNARAGHPRRVHVVEGDLHRLRQFD